MPPNVQSCPNPSDVRVSNSKCSFTDAAVHPHRLLGDILHGVLGVLNRIFKKNEFPLKIIANFQNGFQ